MEISEMVLRDPVMLEEILSHLMAHEPWPDEPYYFLPPEREEEWILQTRKSLAVSARVCKFWSSVALPILRRNDTTLEELFDAVDVPDDDLVQAVPRTLDYAKMVQSITIPFPDGQYLDWFRALSYPPKGPLFPNLTAIVIQHNFKHRLTENLKYLLCDCVTSIEIEFDGQCLRQQKLAEFIHSIADNCPRIQKISFGHARQFLSSPPEVFSAMQRLLASLSNLRTVTLPHTWYDKEILRILGGSNNLTEIHCSSMEREDLLRYVQLKPVVVDDDDPKRLRTTLPPFPTLRGLTWISTVAHAENKIVKLLSPISLTRLTLFLLPDISDSSRPWDLTEGMQNLTHLYVTFIQNKNGPWSKLGALGVSELSAMASGCNNLISLRLNHPLSYNLDDSDIERLAKCWPKLELLDLFFETYPAQGVRSKITLLSLNHLVELCPKLKALDVSFDSDTPLDSKFKTFTPTKPHPLLTEVNLGTSFFNDGFENVSWEKPFAFLLALLTNTTCEFHLRFVPEETITQYTDNFSYHQRMARIGTIKYIIGLVKFSHVYHDTRTAMEDPLKQKEVIIPDEW